MIRYRFIIFDCDGTLVDTEQLLNMACSQALISLGFTKYTPSYCLNNFIGKNLIDVVKTIKQEINSKDDSWVKEFSRRCNIIAPQLLKDQVKPIQDASYILEKLKNVQKCVASNGSKECVMLSLKTAKLIEFFDLNSVYTYELVTNPKPAPDLFLYAAKQFDIDPSDCLVIEDSLVGVTAAKNANMDVLVYRSEYAKHNHEMNISIDKLKPTKIINNLREILDYF